MPMELMLKKRYLNFPVRTGAPRRRVTIAMEGQVLREFDIDLAPDDPEFWVFLDVSAFHGARATLSVAPPPDTPRWQAAIAQEDALRGAEEIYREPLRPQFHFSTRRGWLNDPNGLVFHRGEYHLYYQHNPYGWHWANMHWGHAVSTDLVHWRELPIAIYPHRYGDWAYSGSAVIDHDNTGGFRRGAEEVIVAFYTSTGRGECLAYSNDRGRTFTDFEGNPVVRHRGRDPKVFWYAPGKHWVMAVYDEEGEGETLQRRVALYTSPDLKQWERCSQVDGFFECPELFELPVDGNPDDTRWLLYGADGDYAVGTFDGRTFTAESGKVRFSYGNCFYASQTFNNVPSEDGRRLQIGWGRIAMPGMPFNQCMLFPNELTLRATADGPRLCATPAREIERLYDRQHSWEDQPLRPGENLLAGIAGELFDIRAELQVGAAAQVGLRVRGVPVVYDVKEQTLTCVNTAPLPAEGGRIRLRLLVDRTSIELYAGEGLLYLPIGVLLPEDDRSLELFSVGGEARVERLEVAELRSAWR